MAFGAPHCIIMPERSTLSGVVMAFGAPHCIIMPERSTLSGGPQPGVEGRGAVFSQGRILRLRRGPYPGSAQDADIIFTGYSVLTRL